MGDRDRARGRRWLPQRPTLAQAAPVADRAPPDPPVPTGRPLIASPTLFTVGHGARTTDELVAVLRSGGVGRVIDVRRYPGSRRHPQFGRDALAADLPRAAVAYEWWGE